MAGHPRIFKTPDEFMEAFSDFIEDIQQNDFYALPTKTSFSKWVVETGRVKKCTRWTVIKCLNEYYNVTKKDHREMLADMLAEGAAMGKYQQTMCIFALKNWCAWSDRPIEEDDSAQKLDAILTAIKEGV